jgi:hypothetical protein
MSDIEKPAEVYVEDAPSPVEQLDALDEDQRKALKKVKYVSLTGGLTCS